MKKSMLFRSLTRSETIPTDSTMPVNILLASSLEYNYESIPNDPEIHGRRHIFNIQDIIFKSFHHLFQVLGIAEFNLAEGGNSGSYTMKMGIMRCDLYNLINKKFSFRSWSDKRHVSNKYVVKL